MASRSSRCRTLSGASCERWQRVGRRRLLRCAKFQLPKPCRKKTGFRDGNDPHNRGLTCKRRKRFYSPYLDEQVLRCVQYEGRRRKPARSKAARPKASSRPAKATARGRRKQPKAAVYAMPSSMVMTPGYVPIMSIPSLEKTQAGRTPARRRR